MTTGDINSSIINVVSIRGYFVLYTLTLSYTSRLPVRCDGLQQYPHKLPIKKSRFFIDCLRSPYNIF
jgi:hypothetical protein